MAVGGSLWRGAAPGSLGTPLHDPPNRLVEPNTASGAYRDRTGDPQLAKLVLSQLS